jgi:hypothetical protein
VFDRLITFMREANQVDKLAPAESMIVASPDFFTKVNDFDVKAVEVSAKDCKF